MKIAFVMDPIISLTPHKDTSVVLMQEALVQGHDVFYLLQSDLYIRDQKSRALSTPVLRAGPEGLSFGDPLDLPLGEMDAVFMRKNPPVDKAFIQTTYILDQAALDGARVINSPKSLRDYNEKLYANRFPQFAPQTLLSANKTVITEFVRSVDRAVLKPLDMMGGYGVFVTDAKDPNLDVIIEMLTERGKCSLLAQKFVPGIEEGDRRLILVNGELMDHALLRFPKEGSLRGNMTVGGGHKVEPVNDRDREIAAAIGPTLVEDGVFFAGIDVIGGYLIEINHTSATGLRQIETQAGENIAEKVITSLTKA